MNSLNNNDPLIEYEWENRILILFAPEMENNAYQKQMKVFSDHREDIKERDLVLFKIFNDYGQDPENEPLNQESIIFLKNKYQPSVDQFTMILIGKDGTEKKRYLEQVSMKSINMVIDAMPMRKAEMRKQSKP